VALTSEEEKKDCCVRRALLINANIKIINNKNVKINLKKSKLLYNRKISRQLTEVGSTWYSYENKNTRLII
jgi:hypothetical protein